MLVLSRRQGESIKIADNIVITIAAIRGASVRLAIEADRSIPILRDNAKNTERK